MSIVYIASDHAGFHLKDFLAEYLVGKGHEVHDLGPASDAGCDYPDSARLVTDALLQREDALGILICGTGIGMAMAANKVKGIRAAVCHDPFSTERSRKSNDAQIMCMGARVIGPELAKMLVKLWLTCDFAGGGSAPKVEAIKQMEEKYFK